MAEQYAARFIEHLPFTTERAIGARAYQNKQQQKADQFREFGWRAAAKEQRQIDPKSEFEQTKSRNQDRDRGKKDYDHER